MILGCSISINALAANDKIIHTYYGTKARNSALNPCKGACTLICGTIETTNSAISEDVTLVTSVVKDSEGNVLSTSYQIVEESADVVMSRQLTGFRNQSNVIVHVVNE